MNIKLKDFTKICRCCRNTEKTRNKFVNIFDENKFAKDLTKITSININENDDLPKNICQKCSKLLKSLIKFIELCYESEEIFRTQCQNTSQTLIDIKVEAIQEFDPLSGDSIHNATKHLNDINCKIEDNESPDVSNTINEEYIYDEEEEEEEDEKKLNEDVENIEIENTGTTNVLSNSSSSNIKKNLIEKKEVSDDGEESYDKNPKLLFKCNICPKKFFRERRLEGHLRQHRGLKPAVCKICLKEFSKWSGLDTHIMYAHTEAPLPFVCDETECTRSYMTKQALVFHKKSYHNPVPVKDKGPGCICEQCGKSFSTKTTLKKHILLHSGQRPFQCTECPNAYLTKHKLKEHLMRHRGIKNFICPKCGLRKTTMHELRVHINYHTKTKPYQCPSCSLSFASSGNRSRHVKIVHRGVKAYSCEYCDKTFGKADTLKHHTMIHTGEKPHECNICGKRFIQLVALQSHNKVHNKNKIKEEEIQKNVEIFSQ